MKNYLSSLAALLFVFMGNPFSEASIIVINAVGTSNATDAFVPNVANAVCGDTIKWVLVSGIHTTASTSIPNGADPWSSPQLTAAGYTYVVKVAGTYNYTCHPNTGGHMNASIIVNCPNGIETSERIFHSKVYPNPFSGDLTVEFTQADRITLYNYLGEQIMSVPVKSGETKLNMNVLELSSGIYFYSIWSDGLMAGSGKVVKE